MGFPPLSPQFIPSGNTLIDTPKGAPQHLRCFLICHPKHCKLNGESECVIETKRVVLFRVLREGKREGTAALGPLMEDQSIQET